MKRLYRMLNRAEGHPVRLIAAIVMSFFVMIFINTFIGSMGGHPAFLGYLFVFYITRTLMVGVRANERLSEMSGRKLIRFQIINYGLFYLLIWGILRVVLIYLRTTGWGKISGVTFVGYVEEMLAASMIEKWAYFFAGVLMFAFILSLFPLIMIRRKSSWIAYAAFDFAMFALICEGIDFLYRLYLGMDNYAKGSCMIDFLLMCGNMQIWMKIASLVAVLLVALGILAGVFEIAGYVFSEQKAGRDVDDFRGFWEVPARKRNAILLGGALVLGAAAAIILLMEPASGKTDYKKVAVYLTEDEVRGPILYQGKIYVMAGIQESEREEYQNKVWKPQGYLAGKEERTDTRFYTMTKENILYSNPDDTLLQAVSDRILFYEPVAELEERPRWKEDGVMLMWDEDWESESALSHEPTGYTVFDLGLLERLEEMYGPVTYREQDFADCDAFFSLYGYENLETAVMDNLVAGDYAGCILIKDNRFFYGSYDNPIYGIERIRLRNILGGYH